jgi:hypothetical protein
MSPTTIAEPALIPDIEAFEERVAIHIHEGGIPTDEAKDLAAQAQGFRNQAHYWAWLRVFVERKRLGWAPDQKLSQLPRAGGWACFSIFFAKRVGKGGPTSS